MTIADLVRATALPMPWAGQAACRHIDPDLWFPQRGASTSEAKAVCDHCPVQRECLQYALDGEEKFGIWGGTSEKERRVMRHNLREARHA